MKAFNPFKVQIRGFATKLKASTSDSKRGPAGKRLGLKKFGGEEVQPGHIILRQRGLKYRPGENTYVTRDHTIHASKEGVVFYERNNWVPRKRWRVHVIQKEIPNRQLPNPPPFVYHPELYPDLAKNNPEPYDLKVPEPKDKEIQKNPSKLGMSLSPQSENHDTITPQVQEDATPVTHQRLSTRTLLAHSDFAYYTVKKHEDQQVEMEVDFSQKTENSKIFSQDEKELLVNFRVYE
ncbi:unnamed protein product [Moneuplotes crassus]|uniref:Ribosomal protein L27 n=1 Tax=Euplotes crassus TaxID=5936 RepID=A0AAD2D3J0_EUPCR|nr:unnamed protein product [Moneuplotes crassus]